VAVELVQVDTGLLQGQAAQVLQQNPNCNFPFLRITQLQLALAALVAHREM
jgi:hypothetical protein